MSIKTQQRSGLQQFAFFVTGIKGIKTMRRGEKLNWWRKTLGSRSGKEKQEHQNEVELTRITRWWNVVVEGGGGGGGSTEREGGRG